MILCGTLKTPPGWYCTRRLNHDGPCAAEPVQPAAMIEDDHGDFKFYRELDTATELHLLNVLRQVMGLVRYEFLGDYGDASDWARCHGCGAQWRAGSELLRHMSDCPIQVARRLLGIK